MRRHSPKRAVTSSSGDVLHSLLSSQSADRSGSEWPSRDILRAALLVAGIWLSLQFLWVARSAFVLTFLGVLFGVALSGGVTWLQRRGVPRAVGTLLILLAFLGVLAGLAWIAAPRIIEQAQQLPEALDRIERWVRA